MFEGFARNGATFLAENEMGTFRNGRVPNRSDLGGEVRRGSGIRRRQIRYLPASCHGGAGKENLPPQPSSYGTEIHFF